MKRQGAKRLAAVLGSVLLVAVAFVSNAEQRHETQKQTEERMVKEAKQSADRAEKREKEGKGDTNYDVKKSHDEHIKETEKAAGEADKRSKSK